MAGHAARTIFSTMMTAIAAISHVNPWHTARNTEFTAAWVRDGGFEI
jgi:hypothetical protein